MNTIEKINVIELASELANRRLIEYSDNMTLSESKNKFPFGIQKETEEGVFYTEQAQDLFNEYYDEYLELINMCKE
jgi:hypothetical protein